MIAGIYIQEIPGMLLLAWLAVLCFVASAGHKRLAVRLGLASAVGTILGVAGFFAGMILLTIILRPGVNAEGFGAVAMLAGIAGCIVFFLAGMCVGVWFLVWKKRGELERGRPAPLFALAGVGLLAYLGVTIHSTAPGFRTEQALAGKVLEGNEAYEDFRSLKELKARGPRAIPALAAELDRATVEYLGLIKDAAAMRDCGEKCNRMHSGIVDGYRLLDTMGGTAELLPISAKLAAAWNDTDLQMMAVAGLFRFGAGPEDLLMVTDILRERDPSAAGRQCRLLDVLNNFKRRDFTGPAGLLAVETADPKVRQDAVSALAAFDTPESWAAVSKAWAVPGARKAVIFGLARFKDSDVSRRLAQEAIDDPDKSVRAVAEDILRTKAAPGGARGGVRKQ